MSGSRTRPPPRSGLARDSDTAGTPLRVRLPLLDRLIHEAPEQLHDAPVSPAEATAILRASVRRDLEMLLNARRRWRSWDEQYANLTTSPLNFGIPDVTGARLHGTADREALRREIEDTIRRFEPRFISVQVSLAGQEPGKDTTLRLTINALLHAEPAPEPIALETTVDPTTANILVHQRDDA